MKKSSIITLEAKEHYNMVSDSWRHIFGDDFHVGYFQSNDQDLISGTKLLIDKLSEMGNFNESSSVLDIGCGIGEPAFHLHEKYKSKITGITISERGEELANKACLEKGLSDKVHFKVADILHNNFPDNSFDIIWIMEVSHLIKDKKRLFSEAYRILKNNGVILLCDFMGNMKHNYLEGFKYYKNLFSYIKDMNTLNRTFGKAHLCTLNEQIEMMKKIGFVHFEHSDVNINVFPTMYHWRNNVNNNLESISKLLKEDQIKDFLDSCNILERLFSDRLLGYRFIKAVKTNILVNPNL